MDTLFVLKDGTEVKRGGILFHPDCRQVGWYRTAEFRADANGRVTVRSPNGAVPTVFVGDLRSQPPVEKRCSKCGQLLPKVG